MKYSIISKNKKKQKEKKRKIQVRHYKLPYVALYIYRFLFLRYIVKMLTIIYKKKCKKNL
jgi:hypothetical protein